MNITLLGPIAALICTVLGISDPGLESVVKSALAAAAALVIAVWTWQTHKTARNADTAAAAAVAAKAAPAPDLHALVASIVDELAAALLPSAPHPAAQPPPAPLLPPLPAAPAPARGVVTTTSSAPDGPVTV